MGNICFLSFSKTTGREHLCLMDVKNTTRNEPQTYKKSSQQEEFQKRNPLGEQLPSTQSAHVWACVCSFEFHCAILGSVCDDRIVEERM